MTGPEHLVIGSGAGGALTATLLAEAGRDVLVLEDGSWVDPGDVEPYSLDQMARQYRHGGLSATVGRPPVVYVEGCCAGGSTEVNAGLYHRAGEETLERWRANNRVTGLESADLDPHAEDIERTLSIQRLPHPPGRASQVLADGAAALGWPAIEVPRFYRYDQGRPVKQSMTQTYLPRAKRAGARIQPDTRVDRLVISEGRAAGAITTRGMVAAEHVWLCAGAIGTAYILQRSGVRRGIGTRLQLHPMVKLAARFQEPLDAGADIAVHQVKPAGGQFSFGGSVSRPGYTALVLADDWKANREAADSWREMAVYYATIRPQGTGRVIAVPGLRDPVVTFSLTRADLETLGKALAELARLLFAAGATAIYPSVRDGGMITSANDVGRIAAAFTRARATVTTVHLFSTAPMGEDPRRCPTDSYGRVRGVHGLRVNDASLLPDAPGVNPQGTVMAIAARNVAEFLAAEG